jgi:hypothetical protein
MISNVEVRPEYILVVFTTYDRESRRNVQTLREDIKYRDLMEVYKWVQKQRS